MPASALPAPTPLTPATRRYAMLAVSLSISMATLDTSMTHTALPSIASQLGVSASDVIDRASPGVHAGTVVISAGVDLVRRGTDAVVAGGGPGGAGPGRRGADGLQHGAGQRHLSERTAGPGHGTERHDRGGLAGGRAGPGIGEADGA
ncbi:hypothetical protein G6F31_018994 [Rhizopus arrhizus]|nr:hypothetical protein G6F31_018994 [Rhizopus arrhizus]